MTFPPHQTHKIAVFRPSQLGDMLCTVPALRALRAAYPTAEITLLSLPWAKAFANRFPNYIDRFIHFPGYPGLPGQPFRPELWQNFDRLMQNEHFDLILQMHGNGSVVNDMLDNLHAGPVAGFHSKGNYRNEQYFIEYPTGISEVDCHLRLLQHLGIPTMGNELEFPVYDTEINHLHQIEALLDINNFVCVHPGSRDASRQWPPSHFACLADQCAGMGFQVVVTGTAEEAPVTRQVIELMDYPAIDLTGKTGLGEIGQLIKEAELLISNRTGISLIAAAVQTPSMVINMDGEPHRWAPANKHLHKIIDWSRSQDFYEVMACMEQILESRYQLANF